MDRSTAQRKLPHGTANVEQEHELLAYALTSRPSCGTLDMQARCRIGHSRLTHSYLLNNEERPEYIPCNSNFSLKYVLIDYVDVGDVRQTFYNANFLIIW
jgi:hypothetical protein